MSYDLSLLIKETEAGTTDLAYNDRYRFDLLAALRDMERMKEAVDILAEYARHGEGCSAVFNKPGATTYLCKCGYDREVKPIVERAMRDREAAEKSRSGK